MRVPKVKEFSEEEGR